MPRSDNGRGSVGISKTDTISAEDAAKLLMLESVRRVQQLAQEGWIEKAGRNRYVTVTVIQGYIRSLREDKREKSVTASETRVRDARARAFEIKNAKDENALIDINEAEAVIDEIAAIFKNESDGLAAAVTRDLTLRKKIQHHVDGIFARASSRIAETLAALAASGEVVDTDTEDDA